MLLITVYWLILHTPGNYEVSVNSRQITSMRAFEGASKGKHLTGEARCQLNMEDGKFVSVVETCLEVRQLINDLEKQKQEKKP